MSVSDTRPVWFITGCSTGFGREFALQCLERGLRVVATARRLSNLDGLDAPSERLLKIELDVTDPSAITDAIARTREAFGRIDVLVNNAGYGYLTSAEEGEEAEIRAMFDANVFGLFAMTRAVLPLMRAQRSGTVVNISSIAGLVARAASSYYGASKYAVEGFTSGLHAEVAHLGIRAMAVEPGPFRTDWAGRSLRTTEVGIEDYRQSVGARLSGTAEISGRQQGDPVRAVTAIIEAASSDNPPLHLVLGAYAVDATRERWMQSIKELDTWEAVGRATDFPD
ncbi:NAD(P)-dependent dehydrogenase (short-subunit alcohol dehydrogenase family) [Endobacter medicaginis]|uniref:NAD(P)-dependent dehydrogenase (Short-subunit alcohol dehydrogenase family) n=1 Tax=Endobacter medicaginis TaxID=1181271 RepID=A0A839V3J8_9PROT|nr:oxidoreductase [Endobacter medicaginis]MBB3174061.1 NAD(P)-dependent dehydrogenase (short-subunit alcohol dehydrogenase family) [Endobacter medicaginis]MCX5476059.1 oxidoreductase [Endobacter medicaginis]NVN30271.1 SDR family NAD(P)-dependent oxidoreductase [Endobacter medicaginis]